MNPIYEFITRVAITVIIMMIISVLLISKFGVH